MGSQPRLFVQIMTELDQQHTDPKFVQRYEPFFSQFARISVASGCCIGLDTKRVLVEVYSLPDDTALSRQQKFWLLPPISAI